MDIQELINLITNAEPFQLTIKDIDRQPAFAASYTTEHYPDDEYIKLFFTDGTLLEIMPSADELFFCDDERREVDRSLISDFDEYLNIDGTEFLANDLNDRQFVKTIYFGDPKDGETDCIFSDYGYADEVWSLAILPNGTISDIHTKRIAPSDIKIKR